jgi:hypothetical protein
MLTPLIRFNLSDLTIFAGVKISKIKGSHNYVGCFSGETDENKL